MHETGVLALVPDDWWVAWERRHQILSRLATYFPVAWISPAMHWTSWLAHHARPSRPQRQAAPDTRMFTIAPADGAPTVYQPMALRRAVFRRRVKRGADWLRQRGCRKVELQIWRPDFAEALDWVPHATSSYHIDDEYSWSHEEEVMSPAERRVIERVDRVYVTSLKLLDTKGGINANTIFSPNGVDYGAFSSPAPEAIDLARIPHPRVGYVGVLKVELDWDLLTALVMQHAEWSFVFIGPVRAVHHSIHEPIARLRRQPNAHFLGEKSVGALPAYVQGIDVALLPYLRNAYMDAINPLKLYEALAAGTPVVASRIRTVEHFASVVTIAEGIDDWNAGIASALTETSRDRKAQRQAVAREYDWDAIVAAMAQTMSGNHKPDG
ncbi:MAG: glycosyltransferase [Gemmatimonadaceae bacterium]|nr:glycosyltransferase [Gemmatimonadaceae bacterium]MDQ3520643.1 glycosyltransferase [Gemmatimonadota bacterium]